MTQNEEDSSKEGQTVHKISDASKFPSLTIALTEIRRRYDTEQTRKSQLETKISAVIAVNALLISLAGTIETAQTFTTIVVLLPSLLSAGLGLRDLNAQRYLQPGPDIDELFGYAREKTPNAQKKFIQNYRQAIKHNTEQNNGRVQTLRWCIYLTALSFILVTLSPLVDLGIEWLSVVFEGWWSSQVAVS